MENSPSKIKSLLILSFCTLFYFIVAATVHAATYYVAANGNDGSAGTLSQPFRTIAKGVSMLVAGDKLYMRGGVYTEQIDLQTHKKQGSSDNYITIAGYPGESVTIRYTDGEGGYGGVKARGNLGYLIFENFILDGINQGYNTGWSIVDGNHHIIVRNVEIKNVQYNGFYIGPSTSDITIQNCTIHDQISTVSVTPRPRYYGIYVSNGATITIEGNKIYNNPGGGIHVYSNPGPISGVVIRGNYIHDNNFLSTSPVGGLIVQGNSTNPITTTQIYNNVFTKNGSASTAGPASGIQISYYTNDTKVWNNTVYGNRSYGIQVGFDTTTVNAVVQNNISHGNMAKDYVSYGTGTTYSNNIISTNPGFLNVDTADFRLQTNSPAIDAGVNLSSVSTDINKRARPQGAAYDVGAYEGSGTSVLIAPPKNLRVQ
jgi:parallel beta-helix repeat protein